MLREGQEILVQVAKEPIAKKGAPGHQPYRSTRTGTSCTCRLWIMSVSPARLRPSGKSPAKDVILKHRDRFAGGVIVRTAAEEHSEEDLTNDLNYLVKVWEDIRMTVREGVGSTPHSFGIEPGPAAFARPVFLRVRQHPGR